MTTTLVHVADPPCWRCGTPTERCDWHLAPLIRHGGYGAETVVSLAYCPFCGAIRERSCRALRPSYGPTVAA